jgi:trans-2,3-dihydro-3-hydroxyanthranilate isomerase
MALEFHTLDVFTDKRFAGNPLAVVLGADALTPEQMQTIAREFNLSETVFVQKPEGPTHSAKVRIFTPANELPFAGHPTIGTAVLLAELRLGGTSTGNNEALVVLEEQIGQVRVGVKFRAGKAPFAEFDAPKLPEELGPLPANEKLAAALGLIPSEIGFENHRPSIWSAGVPFAFIPVATMAAIRKASVRQPHFDGAFTAGLPRGAVLYCRETAHTTSSFHVRMFAPAMGVVEDPATGGAAAAFAGIVKSFDALPDGQHRRVIEQGFEMGRPSLINLAVDVQRGKITTVRIGGHAVRVSEGKLIA